jgi:predicted small secreted protein
MKQLILIIIAVAAFAASIALSGCSTTKQAVQNLEDKAVTLSGTFLMNKIVTMDVINKTPSVISLVGYGNYTSVPTGMEFIQYHETSDASIFNSASKSTSIFFLFASSEKKRADEVISAISERLKVNKAKNER